MSLASLKKSDRSGKYVGSEVVTQGLGTMQLDKDWEMKSQCRTVREFCMQGEGVTRSDDLSENYEIMDVEMSSSLGIILADVGHTRIIEGTTRSKARRCRSPVLTVLLIDSM